MALRVNTNYEKTYEVHVYEGWEDEEETDAGEVEPTPDVGRKKLATFSVRPIPRSEFNKMLKKHTTATWDAPNKKTKPERFEETDWFSLTRERVQKIIVDWDGLVDENKNPIEVSDKNKFMLHDLEPDLIAYVLDKASNISNNIETDQDEEVKNSKSGSIGQVGPGQSDAENA